MKDFIIDAIGRLDLIVWLLVILFFCGSSMLFGGDLQLSFIGAGGIIFEMLIISVCIEIIIECLKDTKGIGTITGFITNGPEALCLIVGLVAGDIIFASSTPLGSNFMNPILLLVATLVCKQFIATFSTHRTFTLTTIFSTAVVAITFYLIKVEYYLAWLCVVLALTGILFFMRPKEQAADSSEPPLFVSNYWLLPAVFVLVGAGYFLDSVVTFAAENSKAPKGLIGFLVLATLTSWPEFKSCISLLSRKNTVAAILNITVSNITNIWLAASGLSFYLLTK
jgi:cation:H+ antiporter